MENKKLKVKNKGQITIFVIIAIVIIVIIGILLFVSNKNLNPTNTNDASYNFVQGCLEQTGERALDYIGKTGGYYNIPEKSTEYANSYYFYDNKNIMPTKENIENETNLFVEDFGVDCASNNPQYGIINRGNVTAKTKIYDDKIEIQVKYPITVEKSSKKINYENFNVEIPGRVGILYKASSEYIQGQVNNPEGICINCINDIANKYDIKFITYNYDNETIIFNLYDNNTKINNQSFYVYSFAVKYNMSENPSI